MWVAIACLSWAAIVYPCGISVRGPRSRSVVSVDASVRGLRGNHHGGLVFHSDVQSKSLSSYPRSSHRPTVPIWFETPISHISGQPFCLALSFSLSRIRKQNKKRRTREIIDQLFFFFFFKDCDRAIKLEFSCWVFSVSVRRYQCFCTEVQITLAL